jgi:pimeloyl-ACP methyl ester carboxylesterase/DNA-binding CsgD family transcriptional regulator
MVNSDEERIDTAVAEEVIDRLYEVAVDPTRYEALLDHWESMIRPQRAAANQIADPKAAPPLGLRHFEGHFELADQVLERVIRDPQLTSAGAMLAQIEHSAAFIVNRSLTLIEVNAAATSVFGVTRGARLADIALAEGETAHLGSKIARMLTSNVIDPSTLRTRSSRSDRLVLLHLRLVRPDTEPAFVLVVSSELAWPRGFSDMLRSAFDLTPAEAEVMQALAEGHSISEIAETRGRSIETIRAQLKAIMSKTETRSQTELVRLTLSTMEMVQFSAEAIRELADSSRGFETLESRPFQIMHLKDGRRLDYLILGDPKGRPCFFFPLDYGLIRWPATAEAEATRRGIKIIVPVRPGFGSSTSLRRGVPYMAQIVEDMAALLDHVGVESVPIVTLGGDSFIGFGFHAAYPERVKALICCAGVLPLSRAEQYERMDKWHRFILAGARYTPHLLPFMVKAGFALARRLGKRGFIHAVYGKSKADVATFEVPEVYEAMVCGSDVALSETHSAHDAFAREVIAHETMDWSTEVAALEKSVPVHFLNGLQDPEVPPETLADHQRDYPWIDFRTYPDAGQLLFFLKWRDVLHLLDRYLVQVEE